MTMAMNRTANILRKIALVTVGLVAVACAAPSGVQPVPPEPGPGRDGIVVRFGASMLSSRLGVTRAADDAEFAVGNISLLVFSQAGGTGDYTYLYTAIGRRISQPGNTNVDFEALLTDIDDPVRLLAVANHADGFSDGLQAGATEAEVRSALTSSDTDLSAGLPMTGVAQLPSISVSTGLVTIPLVRSVAKATVAVDPDGDSPDFTITGAEVWRTPEAWQMFPAAANISDETTAPKPTAPSPPASVSYGNRALGQTGGSGPFSGYIFDTALPTGQNPASRASCLVVSGHSGDDPDTYYRINFGRLADSANPLGQVLRNTWYEFTITGVDGPGWDTPENAAANPASGLRTTATPWDGGGNTDFYFGENEFIRLSTDQMVLAAQTGSTTTMTISTSGAPFSLSSVHHPGAGLMEISGTTGGSLETEKMRFEMQPLAGGAQGEQRWLMRVTALTSESVTDYLQLHAADGLISATIFVQRDPAPGDEPPQNDPAKRRIRVLTLGSDTYGSLNRQTNRGVPAMLRNSGYFGPEGTVACAGIEILPTMTSTTDGNAVAQALAGADIIVTTWAYYLNADANGSAVSHAIWNWITEKGPNSGRVAFLTSDSNAVITELRGLLDGQMIWRTYGDIADDPATDYGYGTGYSRFAPAAAANDDPFLDGVFGDARGLATNKVSIDGTTQYINIAGATHPITPLIVADGTSGLNNNVVLMGVDTERNIVYLGESRLLHTEGMGTTTNSSLAYDPDNYVNAVWSNTWAWAVQRVITENYNVPEALVE